MLSYQDEKYIELGIDEAGRGCLFGKLFCAGVILPNNFADLCKENKITIKDSKKMSKKKRIQSRKFIEENAIDFVVVSKDSNEIDEKNIFQATMEAMHDVVNNIKTKPNKILVDGNHFKFYRDNNGDLIPHECVVNGDNTYMCIAAASILAKTYKDEYIENIVNENEDYKKYDLLNNSGYGTKKHLEAIKKYGITKDHRKSYGPCKLFHCVL